MNLYSIMLRITFIITCLCLFISNIQAQKSELLDKIIAKVGNEILLKSELDENMALARDQSGALPPDAECFMLNQLLGQKLLVNQSRVDSIAVSDEEVTAQMNARFDQILGLMNNDHQEFENYYGMTVSDAKNKLKRDLEDQMRAQKMRREVIANTQITPKEVLHFFNAIPKDSLPYFNSEVEVGEIVFIPKPNEKELERAKQEAEKLRSDIVEGKATFAEMASRHSSDPGSARLGGDLGWQKRGQFVPEFEAVAYTLDKGEVSEVVQTEFGYHIIQLLERLGNRVHTRHILIQPRVEQADLDLAEQKLKDVQRLIDEDSITFSQAVKEYSSDKEQSYFNDGLMSNPKTGTTFFETSDLDVDIYFAIDTMQVGQVSSPIPILTPAGETQYKLIHLVSMTAPHQASLKEDFSKIKKAAIEEKKVKNMEKWMKETIQKTHIKLDEQYEKCEVLKHWTTKKIN